MGIVEILFEKGLITPDHLAEAMELRKKEGLRLDRALVQARATSSEEQLLEVMSEQLSIPMVDLSSRHDRRGDPAQPAGQAGLPQEPGAHLPRTTAR